MHRNETNIYDFYINYIYFYTWVYIMSIINYSLKKKLNLTIMIPSAENISEMGYCYYPNIHH